MLMADVEIREALQAGHLIIENFSEGQLQGASYDLRVGKEIMVSNKETVINMEEGRFAKIEPGEFALISTYEFLKVPNDIAANIGGKTYFTRKGLIPLTGLQVDPGFEGILAIGVFNSSPKSIVIEYLSSICTIQFFKLSAPVEKPFAPTRYQEDLRKGKLPRVDIDFFRDLETASLTEVGRDLRNLAQQVGALTSQMQAFSKVLYYAVIPLLALTVMVTVTITLLR